jgi:excisionase family DNA binding protein
MKFTPSQIDLLRSGLVLLENTLEAVKQPVPSDIPTLKSALSRQARVLVSRPKETLTTDEVAEMLRCTSRHVSYLAAQQKIRLVQPGKRGRGNTARYDAKSVKKLCAQIDHSR